MPTELKQHAGMSLVAPACDEAERFAQELEADPETPRTMLGNAMAEMSEVLKAQAQLERLFAALQKYSANQMKVQSV
jgi:hypothetical protein